MKKTLFVFFYLCLSLFAIGQVPVMMFTSNRDYGFDGILWGDYEPVPADSLDSELTRVYYDFTFNGEKEISGIWLLQVGSTTTRFLPENRYKADSIQRSSPKKISLFSSHCKDGDLFHFFDSYYVSKNECRFICRFALDDIMYEDTLPAISWELQDSVANICGHLCKSATGTFRGRTYSVFYAEDIPVSAGPWKLSGLPGLILHADVDGGKFTFHAMQIGPATGAPILWTKYPYMKVSRKQYEKMLDQMQQNFPVAYPTHLTRNPNVHFGSNPTAVYPDLSWVERLEKE